MDTSCENTPLVRPDKLLRIELSSACGYRCRFCCWQNAGLAAPYVPFPLEGIRPLCQALAETGCRNINITGGEPLQLPLEYLCDVVREIRAAPGIGRLWVATNGQRLRDGELCRRLAAAGLGELAVSIAAETNEKYRLCTGVDTSLDDILVGIENARAHGMAVRVHVPLNPLGVSTFEQLEILLRKLRDAGVHSAFYFRLHNDGKIRDRYNVLFVDPAGISRGFERSGRWRPGESESGRPYYTDGVMQVNVPRESVRLATRNCMRRDCGRYCQGIYAAYLVPDAEGWHVRACHRVFEDGCNVHRLDPRLLSPGSGVGLKNLFRTVWRFAYED